MSVSGDSEAVPAVTNSTCLIGLEKAEAIALAMELGDVFVILDDRKARQNRHSD